MTTKKIIVGDVGVNFVESYTSVIILNRGTSDVFLSINGVINSDSFCLMPEKQVTINATITSIAFESSAGNNDIYLIYG